MSEDTNKEAPAPQVTIYAGDLERLQGLFKYFIPVETPSTTPVAEVPMPQAKFESELVYTPDANLHGQKPWSYREAMKLTFGDEWTGT
jgi:hypothetical protein